MTRAPLHLIVAACASFLPFAAAADPPVRFTHHELRVVIEPASRSLSVTDTVTLPPSAGREVELALHEGLAPETTTPGVDLRPEGREDGPAPRERFRVLLPEGVRTFTLRYGGVIHHPLVQTGKEQARGQRDTPGIISEDGVYLTGASGWYPSAGGGLVTFTLETDLPSGWDSVSQGERTLQDVRDGRTVTRWSSPEPQDDLYLVAGRFTEFLRPAGSTLAMVFLREPDAALAVKYLDATATALALYEELIGPYPYRKFALVENFWETGFGMPSFTLLGPTIIRLPFIPVTSYPHEILHSWWGNSVYPGAGGNWSEGLTAYLADHLLKEQQGGGAEYRATTLQKYADYVRTGSDFPLTEFASRHSTSTEAVGYGKSQMLFHMLRRELGDDAFRAGLRKFYRKERFHRATFDDLRRAFERASGRDLKRFFRQWVSRTGAPVLALSDVSSKGTKEGHLLSLKLRQMQPGEPYRLRVPVSITLEGADAAFSAEVEMTGKTHHARIAVPGRPLRVDVDPEYDLFRRLHRDEMPPAITQALGAAKMLVVLPSASPPALLAAYRSFGDDLAASGPDAVQVKLDRELRSLPADRSVAVLGWENRFAGRARAALPAEITDRTVMLGRAVLPREGHTFVLTGRSPADKDEALLFVATDRAEALPGLGRKLPHYHKYGYLAFEGDEPANVAKGRWDAGRSPLTAMLAPGAVAAKYAARRPLAELPRAYSKERMRETISFLSGGALQGRGTGSAELDRAADRIAETFAEAGLLPGGDGDGSWFQEWTDRERNTRLRNVVGILPGKNPAYAGQSVVLAAHYDHLGTGGAGALRENSGKVHPGADDNASGVAVLLELARALRALPAPERSIVFAAFTGEEAGRLGSRRYVAAEQRHPAGKAVGMVNLDTVGRLEGKKLLILGGSSAREWVHIFRGAGFAAGVETEMAAEDLDASDQASFHEAGVPAVQLFSGPHPDYHRPTDTPDRIDTDGLVKVAAVAKEAVEYLANRPEPLTPTLGGGGPKRPELRAERKVSLGAMPDFAFPGPGVRLTGTMPGSPAEKAGLREGDVILRLNDTPLAGLKDLSDALKAAKPGDRMPVLFLRAGKETRATVELKER